MQKQHGAHLQHLEDYRTPCSSSAHSYTHDDELRHKFLTYKKKKHSGSSQDKHLHCTDYLVLNGVELPLIISGSHDHNGLIYIYIPK